MIQVFILCHEGELPYVESTLQDVLDSGPTIQIISQGSTEKMYMGYLLLECDGEVPAALLAELRANADVYLYAIHDPNAPQDATDTEESETLARVNEAIPIQL